MLLRCAGFARGYLLAVVVALIASHSMAQEAGDLGYIRAGGARIAGMSGAFVSVGNDPFSAFVNPAGLSSLERTYMAADISRFSVNTHNAFGVVAGKVPRYGGVGAVSAAWVVARKNLDQNARDLALFDDFRGILQFSYGRTDVLDRTSIGGSLKLLAANAGAGSEHGASADIGMVYQVSNEVSLGVAFRDFMEFVGLGGRYDKAFPMTGAFGASYRKTRFTGEWDILAAAELRTVEDDESFYAAGLEVQRLIYDRALLSLRGGVNSDGVAAGLGVEYNWMKVDYSLAATPDHPLMEGPRHTFSLTVQPLEMLPRVGVHPDSIRARYRRGAFQESLDDGRAWLRLEEYEDAVRRLHQAQEFAGNREDSAQVQEDLDLAERGWLAEQLSRTVEDSLRSAANELNELARQARESGSRQSIAAVEENIGIVSDLINQGDFDAAQTVADLNSRQLDRLSEATGASEEISDLKNRADRARRQILPARNRTIENYADAGDRLAQHRSLDSLIIALEEYGRALLLDPSHERSSAGRLNAISLLTDLVVARNASAPVVTPPPTLTMTEEQLQDRRNEGTAYYRNGDYAKAIEIWNEVLSQTKSVTDSLSILEDIRTARARMESEETDQ